MIILFRYMYYRIAHALSHAKDSWTRFHHDSYAMSYLAGSVYSNILVILMLVRYWMFDIPANNKDTIKYCILYVLIPFAIICFCIWPNDELYMKLDQKYKNEKHRKLKGWLILVYIILSILLPIPTIILLWEWYWILCHRDNATTIKLQLSALWLKKCRCDHSSGFEEREF